MRKEEEVLQKAADDNPGLVPALLELLKDPAALGRLLQGYPESSLKPAEDKLPPDPRKSSLEPAAKKPHQPPRNESDLDRDFGRGHD